MRYPLAKKLPFHICFLEKLHRSVGRCFKSVNKLKKKYLSRYFAEIYAPIIKKYENLNTPDVLDEPIPKIIWVLWWQGDYRENRLVNCCINRMRQLDFDLRVVSKDNIEEYVDISDVRQYYEKGLLKTSALADIIRLRLLISYGGIWLDASVFVVDESFLDSVTSYGCFYSGHFSKYPSWKNISGGMWTTYFLASCSQNPLLKFCDDALVYCLKLHGRQIDYIMFDYTIACGYASIPFFKTMIDRIPYNNDGVWALKGKLNKRFDQNVWANIERTVQLLKFSVANDKAEDMPYKTFFDKMREIAEIS